MIRRALLVGAVLGLALSSLRCPAVTSGPEIGFTQRTGDVIGRPFPSLPASARIGVLAIEETLNEPGSGGCATPEPCRQVALGVTIVAGYQPDPTNPINFVNELNIGECRVLGAVPAPPPDANRPIFTENTVVDLLGLSASPPQPCSTCGELQCQPIDCRPVARGGCTSVGPSTEKFCRRNQCTRLVRFTPREDGTYVASRAVSVSELGAAETAVRFEVRELAADTDPVEANVSLPERARLARTDDGGTAAPAVAWQVERRTLAGFAVLFLRGSSATIACRALDSDRRFTFPAAVRADDADGGTEPLSKLVSGRATLELVRMNVEEFKIAAALDNGVAVGISRSRTAVVLPSP